VAILGFFDACAAVAAAGLAAGLVAVSGAGAGSQATKASAQNISAPKVGRLCVVIHEKFNFPTVFMSVLLESLRTYFTGCGAGNFHLPSTIS
jgi:hypothetical protein